jgi:hypothetical protein
MLGACAAGFKATHDHDSGHDFSKYQTFAWISENPMKVGPTIQTPNPLLQPRIMNAVEDALRAKGYQLADKAEFADFVLSFTVGSREKIDVQSYPTMSMGYSMGYPSHWRWGAAYHCCASDTQVRQYTKGILAIDVFDVKERRPVWHGSASKTISEKDRKDIETTVRAAVDAILGGFPPS